MTMSSKKTFKESMKNPALQFISVGDEETETVEIPAAAEEPEAKKTEAAGGRREAAQVVFAARNPPARYTTSPLYFESKSRRLNLLVQPSIYEKAKIKAQESGKSFNDFVHMLLEQATEEED